MNRTADEKYILMVDDEPEVLSSQTLILNSIGEEKIIHVDDGNKVMPEMENRPVKLVLLDLTLPHHDGEKILEMIKEEYPWIPVIVITGSNDVETAVSCMRKGAFDYLVKAVEKNRFISSIRHALELGTLQSQYEKLKDRFFDETLNNPESFSHIITQNRKMNSIFRYLEIIGKTNQPLLIWGETGTGKELIAQAVHEISNVAGSFIPVSVAGLDDALFSDTLFGHKKGAFTGAEENRKGLIQQAGNGTLFLDEIGDLQLVSQIKLLRLLESGEYYQLGSDILRRSNARIILATHRPLEQLLREERFRKDLYYRISTHRVDVPPLRERKGDIPLLFKHFVRRAAKTMSVPEPQVPREIFTLLYTYHFPGNVRELRAFAFDAVSKQQDGVISRQPFKDSITRTQELFDSEPLTLVSFSAQLPTIKETTETLIDEALQRSSGNISAAADLLGISHQALSKRLQRRNRK
jgi:DNA-binding NtrC family response regulator